MNTTKENGMTAQATPHDWPAPYAALTLRAPTVEWEDITPAKAHDLLGGNIGNRNLSQRAVSALARDMLSGDWSDNGETIKVTANGILVDGQHRLAAVVESGCTVRMLVVRGITREAQASIDTGRKRQFSNVLQMSGEVDCIKLAALVRIVWAWERQQVKALAANFANADPTNAELHETLERNPHLREVLTLARAVYVATRIPARVAGLAIWRLEQVDAADAAAFFDLLRTGTNLPADSPIYQLREVFMRRAKHAQTSDVRLHLALIFKAWNKWRRGEPCSVLSWRAGGAKPEQFPEPV